MELMNLTLAAVKCILGEDWAYLVIETMIISRERGILIFLV